MKFRSIVLVVSLLLVAGLLGCVGVPEATGPIRTTVLFFNDVHGHLLPFKVRAEDGTKIEVGGMARLASLVARRRAEDEARGARTCVLVAGDILQGTPMSTVFRGRPDVEVFNALGVDAVTVGNHEFDFGLENFQALRGAADFPFLSTNVVWKETGVPLCAGRISLPLAEGLDLTVIGVTTEELLTTTSPKNVERIGVLDPVTAIRPEYEEASARGPVLLLSHSKAAADDTIARAFPGLVAIVGGHDQILLNPRREVGPVPVFQAFEKGRYLGVLGLETDPASGATRVVEWDYLPVTAEIDSDPRIAGIIDSYRVRLDKRFLAVIGTSTTFLDGEREHIRYEETALGNFVTDVMREHTGADVALLNAGSLRASIDEGPVTMEAVFKTMPYENELITVTLEGRELLEVLARGASGARQDEDGGFLHVSGLRLTIRDRAPRDVLVHGEPVDPGRLYTVAITDFMASGGDGYRWFTGRPSRKTGSPLRELLVETIRARKTISGAKEGRIRRPE